MLPWAWQADVEAGKRTVEYAKVAVIDKPGMLGGVCVNTGTIPSKTFREAVLHLTGACSA